MYPNTKASCMCRLIILSCVFIAFWTFVLFTTLSCRKMVDGHILKADNNGMLINTCNITFEFQTSTTTCIQSHIFIKPCPALGASTGVLLPVCYGKTNPCYNFQVAMDPKLLHPYLYNISIFFLILSVILLIFSIASRVKATIEVNHNNQHSEAQIALPIIYNDRSVLLPKN